MEEEDEDEEMEDETAPRTKRVDIWEMEKSVGPDGTEIEVLVIKKKDELTILKKKLACTERALAAYRESTDVEVPSSSTGPS